MSRFKNEQNHALSFDLGGKRLVVEPGEEISIHPRIAFAVKRMGVPLTQLESDEDDVAQAASDERPTDPVALLWHGRAIDMRKQVYALQGELSTAKARITAADEEISGLSTELLTVGEALAAERASVNDLSAAVLAKTNELATLTAERTALLAKVTTLEEAATAPAPKVKPTRATPAGDPPATPSSTTP